MSHAIDGPAPLQSEYIDVKQLAALLRKHPRTIQNWGVRRIGPPRIKVRGKTLFRVEAVRRWLNSLEEKV